MKMKSSTAVFIFLVIRTVGVLSRDLSESDRTNRAAFIQRLLNKEKYLEGRVKLVGGHNRFEGKFINSNMINIETACIIQEYRDSCLSVTQEP